MGRGIDTIPSSALEALARYDWPGNILELQNVLERSVILTGGNTLRVAMPEVSDIGTGTLARRSYA
jgi:formate hydrogenlyase transcriptional activator